MVIVLAFLWITALALLDLAYSGLAIFGAVSIAAVAVALWCSPPWVAGTAAYAFAWSLFLGADGYWTPLHFTRLGLSALVGVSSVALSFARGRRESSMVRMTDVAIAAQRALLRPLPAAIAGTVLSARYISASEDALVGGDFYEAADTPFGTRVIVGDVVGRGLEAVDLAALVLGGFREAALSAPDLVSLARRLDAVVRAYARRDEYATAIIAEIRDGEIGMISCGHPMPLLVDIDANASFMELPPALPLGYGSDPTEVTYHPDRGQRLLLYTDGMTEGREPGGDFFDLQTEAAAVLRSESGEQALDELLRRLEVHTKKRLGDDVALMLVEPGAQAVGR